MTSVLREFDRLRSVFDKLGYEVNAQPCASDAEIDSIVKSTGVDVDESLKQLWRITNGSGGQYWFVQGEDEFTPYVLLPIKNVLERWRLFAPYDAALYEEWYDDEVWGERDPRIQRRFLRHSKWISFAEFTGGGDMLHFDADPTSNGRFGQVINYVHDPDFVVWLAESFLEFFRESNDKLEQGIKDGPKYVADQLWLSW